LGAAETVSLGESDSEALASFMHSRTSASPPAALERARDIAAVLIDEVYRGALGYSLITARNT
jgi:hypothetical protein